MNKPTGAALAVAALIAVLLGASEAASSAEAGGVVHIDGGFKGMN